MILIVPISAVVGAAFNSITANPKDVFFNLFSSWYTFVLIFAEFGLIFVASQTKNKALDIYDKLYPDSRDET